MKTTVTRPRGTGVPSPRTPETSRRTVPPMRGLSSIGGRGAVAPSCARRPRRRGGACGLFVPLRPELPGTRMRGGCLRRRGVGPLHGGHHASV
jgi:hypothetical protein